MRGWVSPSGERFEVDSGITHDDAARELLDEFHPGWRWDDDEAYSRDSAWFPRLALLDLGWIRVVTPWCIQVGSAYALAKFPVQELLLEAPQSDEIVLEVEGRVYHDYGEALFERLDDIWAGREVETEWMY